MRQLPFDDSAAIPQVSRRCARAFLGTALAVAVVPAEFDWGNFVTGSSLGERTALLFHNAGSVDVGSVDQDITTSVPPDVHFPRRHFPRRHLPMIRGRGTTRIGEAYSRPSPREQGSREHG